MGYFKIAFTMFALLYVTVPNSMLLAGHHTGYLQMKLDRMMSKVFFVVFFAYIVFWVSLM